MKKQPRYGPEIKAQARELREAGHNYSAIARLLGVPSVDTIRRWIDPKATQYHAQYREQNKDRRAQQKAQWNQENKEYKAQYAAQWHQENKERRAQYHAQYYQENPEKYRAHTATRRARKRDATPPWFASQHQKQINALHAKAVRLEQETGTQHHVDHIYPLTGKTMVNGRYIHTSCGLHVPWNLQVLPEAENCSKHCKMPDPAVDPPTAW